VCTGDVTLTTSVYSFAGATWAAGGNLSTGFNYSSGAGTATFGLLMGGETTGGKYSAVTELYTYASNTVTIGASLINAGFTGAGAGNSLVGVICGGAGTVAGSAYTQVYTYATNGVVLGTNLSVGMRYLAGAAAYPGWSGPPPSS
jgi:hypothetical protein